MRIVVDTNVFASALTSATGSNREVLRACFQGRIVPLMGSALFNEYEDLAARPSLVRRCPLNDDERARFIDAFFSCCQWTRIYFLWRPNLPDEADNHVIELAVAGGASAIVTNNLRHLKAGELLFPGLRILKPSTFLKSLP
jgi:putative PIN family toxin of toxin-antitoxin system